MAAGRAGGEAAGASARPAIAMRVPPFSSLHAKIFPIPLLRPFVPYDTPPPTRVRSLYNIISLCLLCFSTPACLSCLCAAVPLLGSWKTLLRTYSALPLVDVRRSFSCLACFLLVRAFVFVFVFVQYLSG